MAIYGEASSAGNAYIQTRLNVSYSNFNTSANTVNISIVIEYRRTNTSITNFTNAPFTFTCGDRTHSGQTTFDVSGFKIGEWHHYTSYTFNDCVATTPYYIKGFVNLSGTSAVTCTSEATIPAYATFPSIGNMQAYAYDTRTGSKFDAGGWFESVYVDFNGFSGGNNNPIVKYEIWYQEAPDNGGSPGAWSSRVLVANVNTTGSSGHSIIGSVNATSPNSDYGTRGYWYRWSVVALGTINGTYSNTELFTNALRKCTVSTYSFSANGGSGAPAKHYKMPGYHFVFPQTVPTRTGYTFAGWKSGVAGPYAAGAQVPGLNDNAITWQAQWTANNYTLTVNPNGGTWNGSAASQSFTQQYNSTKSIPNPARTGYTFAGWSKSGSGSISGTTFTYGAGNTTLTANWKIDTWTVSFDANGGSGAPGSQTKTYGQTLTLSSTIPVRDGYTFVKWNTAADGSGISYNPGQTYTANAALNLYAIWQINARTVIFDAAANGGTTDEASRKVNVGKAVGELPAAKRQYYKFLGWYTLPEGGDKITAEQIITEDVTYYAHFRLEKCLYQMINGRWEPMYAYVGHNQDLVRASAYVNTGGVWKRGIELDSDFNQTVVGLQVDYENKTFKRLAGADDLSAGANFDNFTMYGGRKRCIVADDGSIVAWYGDANYAEDGSIGQVMVYQPKFYYRVVPLKLDLQTDGLGYHLRKANYYVSTKPHAGFKLHPAFYDAAGNEVDYILYSAYEGSLWDADGGEDGNGAYILDDAQVMAVGEDKFCSISGVKPASGKTQQLTRPNIEHLAQNRGTGWHGDFIKAESANQLLMIIEMGMMNLQTAIGKGVVSIADNPNTENNSIQTGGTSALGNVTGEADGAEEKVSITYRGVENPWGNIWKFVYGVNIHGNGSQKGGIPYICNDFNFAESKNSGNYVGAGFTISNAFGYISAMGYSEDFDWLFLASETLGNGSIPVGDYTYVTANLNGYRIALLGGAWITGTSAGFFYWHLWYGVGYRDRVVGGRLVYVPDKNSASYMQATILKLKDGSLLTDNNGRLLLARKER